MNYGSGIIIDIIVRCELLTIAHMSLSGDSATPVPEHKHFGSYSNSKALNLSFELDLL